MGVLLEYIKEQAEKKKKSPAEWLVQVAGNADKCVFATHVGRFTNPDVKVIWQDDTVEDLNTDYVATKSVQCADDIATGANYLASAKLLALVVEDGQTIYQKLSEDRESLRSELASLAINYDEVVDNLLKIRKHPQPEATDERLRQVYFPVGKDDYHLLTVLPPSSIMVELTKRIRKMNAQRKKARDTDDEAYGSAYKQLYDLTLCSFGGTKPQNISFLNNEISGKAYMLASVPPKLQKRDIIRPRRDFFSNTLRLRDFYALFQSMHKVYLKKQNDLYVRRHARNIEDVIIDRVVANVYVLRQLEIGWTEAESNELPKNQKIWLDNKYLEERLSEDSWQDEIVPEFTRWIMQSYERVVKKEKSILLGSGEFNALQKRVRLAVQKTVNRTAC